MHVESGPAVAIVLYSLTLPYFWLDWGLVVKSYGIFLLTLQVFFMSFEFI
jgi:hypothetical protein